jgi:hypothetical protein
VRVILAVSAVVVAIAGASLWRATLGQGATRTQWVRNADAACLKTKHQFDKLPKSDGTLRQLIVVLPKLTALNARLLEQLRTVQAPSRDRVLVQRLYASWEDELAADRRAYKRLKAGSVASGEAALERSMRDDIVEDAMLRKLGSICRRVPS